MDRRTMNTQQQDLHSILPKMFRLGRFHAVREGVPLSELEDCETTFVERMLLIAEEPEFYMSSVLREAWLHRCARNHARNFRRHIFRRDRQCVSISALHEQVAREKEASEKQSPEFLLLRNHTQSTLDTAFGGLIPEMQRVLLSHYMLGLTASEIARRSGKSTHAVEQALYRARRLMRGQLAQQGVSASDGWPELG
jgi:RNA polymerase sigma factor (sigma-70 family)